MFALGIPIDRHQIKCSAGNKGEATPMWFKCSQNIALENRGRLWPRGLNAHETWCWK